MIESIRKSACSHLALFAICTYGIGFFLTMIVLLFHQGPNAAVISPSDAHSNGLHSVELNAATMIGRIRIISIILWGISIGTWALTFVKESNGGTGGIALLVARMMYILSFLAIIAAVSTAIFFGMCIE